MKKLAIIGASYLQVPLIKKAKEMGIETHVFAWQVGDEGELIADYFYPISIIEKEQILEECKRIGIDGITSIASDLAVVTVNYVAEKLGLTGNTIESSLLSTNKHNMRLAFESNGDPSPKSILVHNANDLVESVTFPVIVKPLDRSGSRGIYKIYEKELISEAVEKAKEVGFEKASLIEEYVVGKEYSVECISWEGKHHFLACTQKYTTGAPHYIETGHIEPADIDDKTKQRVIDVIYHALDSLKIRYGASHSEIKINENGDVTIIEIGARMGGDFIGSTLVQQSTGIDFVRAVIQVALGEEPDLCPETATNAVGVHFIFDHSDIEQYEKVKKEHPEYVLEVMISPDCESEITDSSTRHGYFIMKAADVKDLIPYMPIMND